MGFEFHRVLVRTRTKTDTTIFINIHFQFHLLSFQIVSREAEGWKQTRDKFKLIHESDQYSLVEVPAGN